MVDIVMNDYVKKLTSELEPLITDLEEKHEELRTKKEYCERVSRFLAYTNGDVNLVGIYADQELIFSNLDRVNSTKEAYKASCYLLKSSDDNVKNLPQYKEANDYILGLINYFKNDKNELLTDIQNLEKICREKEIEKKYFDILTSANPLVDDVLEFREFLDKHVVNDEEKVNILLYTINNNVINYKGKRS